MCALYSEKKGLLLALSCIDPTIPFKLTAELVHLSATHFPHSLHVYDVIVTAQYKMTGRGSGTNARLDLAMVRNVDRDILKF